MYDKHEEIKEEAYKLLRKLDSAQVDPASIKAVCDVKRDMNERYAGEYHVEFEPVGEVNTHFVVNVTVHTVH